MCATQHTLDFLGLDIFDFWAKLLFYYTPCVSYMITIFYFSHIILAISTLSTIILRPTHTMFGHRLFRFWSPALTYPSTLFLLDYHCLFVPYWACTIHSIYMEWNSQKQDKIPDISNEISNQIDLKFHYLPVGFFVFSINSRS